MKDTTFRSVLFGMPEVDIEKKGSQMAVLTPVDPNVFREYELFLMSMAQLSRLVYCDSGIIREVLCSILEKSNRTGDLNFVMKPSDFDALVEKTINDNKDLLRKASAYTNSKEGRPMESYVIQEPETVQTGGVGAAEASAAAAGPNPETVEVQEPPTPEPLSDVESTTTELALTPPPPATPPATPPSNPPPAAPPATPPATPPAEPPAPETTTPAQPPANTPTTETTGTTTLAQTPPAATETSRCERVYPNIYEFFKSGLYNGQSYSTIAAENNPAIVKQLFDEIKFVDDPKNPSKRKVFGVEIREILRSCHENNNIGYKDDVKEIAAAMTILKDIPVPSATQPKGCANLPPGGLMARYISTSSDLTLLAIPGLYNESDLVLCFKGSSTAKNFKHDLYSQFTTADLGTLMPPGTKMSSTTTKNYVPASFVNPLVKAWDVLSQTLQHFKPTRVFITGHSLGGAYATLFGFILAECRVANFPAIESIHIVSFGAPTLLGDGARNTFNAHLDSGKVTLDRVVSYANVSRTVDPITKIPAGFSHPGFQPLQTELYPETTTGRAYHLDMIKKVYQTGGVFGSEKSKYIAETKTHMPNKVMIPATSPLAQAFPHKQYYVSWNTAYVFRTAGMKNPGFKGNTFVADLLTDGIRFQYVSGDPNAVEDPTETTANDVTPPKGGRTPRNKKRNETYKQKRIYNTM